MAAVYVSNLVINTGATFTQKFTLENVSSNSALELSGFGIKSAEDAKLLSQCSDGVIIGSSIVQMIEESSQSKEFDRIRTYITDIKKAISWVFFKI